MYCCVPVQLWAAWHQTLANVNISFCFCGQADDGCVLAETYSWFRMISKLLCSDWLYFTSGVMAGGWKFAKHCKKAVVACSRNHTGLHLVGLGANKVKRQDSGLHCVDTNPVPSEFKPRSSSKLELARQYWKGRPVECTVCRICTVAYLNIAEKRDVLRYVNSSSYNEANSTHQFLRFIFGIKLYMFRTVPLSVSRSFSLYTQQWYMSYSLRAGSWWSSVLILLASCQ